jgi:thiosulfate reductase cytochrome b subunit
MKRDTYQGAARAAIRYLLLVLTLIYLISGLGITQYQTIKPLTLGLLTRNLAFRIHDFLLIPFIVLLLVHVLFGPAARVYSHLKREQRQQHS